MTTKTPRSDRQPYRVHPYRGYWHANYYTKHGERKTNVPLYMSADDSRVPVKIPVLRDDPDRCPNRRKAEEAARALTEIDIKPAPRVPGLMEAIDVFEKSLRLKGLRPKGLAGRMGLLRCTVRGVGVNPSLRRKGAGVVDVKGTGWQSLADVTRNGLREFLAGLMESNRVAATRNQYLAAWQQFMKFCHAEGYVASNPLVGFERARKGRKKRPTRAFSLQEFDALLRVVPENRRLYYLTLGLSGLRRNEAKNLIREHMDPVAEKPVWKLPGDIQKVQKHETLPMWPALAKAWRERWLGLRPGERLFPTPVCYKRFYADLDDAGIARVDARGERICIHAFRYFFCVQCAKVFSMKQVQILMRHKTLAETADTYCQLHIDQDGEVWKFPDLGID